MYENLSVKQLKELAKTKGIKGYSKMNTAALIAALSSASAETKAEEKNIPKVNKKGEY